MGTEYNLYNHYKASFFELGKGPWYKLNDLIPILYKKDNFLDFLKKEWRTFSDTEEAKIKYYTLIAQAVQEFVKDSPEKSIKCFGDSGDEDLWADYLKYEFAGSRYFLDSPEEYKNYIDLLKKQISEFKEIEEKFKNLLIDFNNSIN